MQSIVCLNLLFGIVAAIVLGVDTVRRHQDGKWPKPMWLEIAWAVTLVFNVIAVIANLYKIL